MKKLFKFSLILAFAFSTIAVKGQTISHDTDGDGWTDAEEIAANTDPFNNTDFPRPKINITSSYYGTLADYQSYPLIVYAYSESTSGTNMGGTYDAILKPESSLVVDSVVFDSSGKAQLTAHKVAPRTVKILSHRHNTCDKPKDVSSGSLWCYYSGSPVVNYNTGVISRGPPGVTVKISYQQTEFISTHIRSGWNRFFGFVDVNGNGVFDVDEPAGLSVSSPTFVSWDAVDIDIALTDAEHLTGYPRIAWNPVTTNTVNNCDHYTVTISAGGGSPAVTVKKPRTFMHEGDLIAAGVHGLDFGAGTQATFVYTVMHCDDLISSGSIYYNIGVTANRKTMKAISPAQGEFVTGANVEFKWDMDYRNEGARLSIYSRGAGGTNEGTAVYDGLINFPVRHGSVTSEGYYYSAVPQNVNGETTFSLLPGSYNYTIKEFIRTTSGSLTKQTTTDWFQVVAD